MPRRNSNFSLDDDERFVFHFEPSSELAPSYEEDDVEYQYQNAGNRLSQLRRQQEELRRQREMLAAWQEMKSEVSLRKQNLNHQLRHSLQELEMEVEELELYSQELRRVAKQNLEQLQELEAIRVEDWNRGEAEEEMDEAKQILERVELAMEQTTQRLEVCRPGSIQSPSRPKRAKRSEAAPVLRRQTSAGIWDEDTLTWMKRGLVFAAPVLLLLIVCMAVLRSWFTQGA